MAKTASYTRAAVDRYNSKFDRVTVNLPLGSKDKITKTTGKSAAAWCRDVLTREIEQIEQDQPGRLLEWIPEDEAPRD